MMTPDFPLFTRSQFLRLSTLGTLGLATRAFALPAGYTGIPAGIRPYLQSPRPDSIWVSWFTAAESSGTIEWGSTPGTLTNTVTTFTDTTLGSGYRYHIGQITGLSPGMFYHYRVRNGATVSETFRFRTPMPDGTKTGRLRVLVMGDNQLAENRFEKLVACAKDKIESMFGIPIEEAIDFILMPGDQVDAGTIDQYRDRHFKFSGLVSPNVPIMTTVGNHETYSDTGLATYRKLFRYSDHKYAGVTSPDPQVYYSYKFGNVAFIHTNSESPYAGSTQTAWVRSLVDQLKADASTDLCVSVVHRPYQAEQYIGDISSWFRSSVMPILAETDKHVLNIGAHHHLYARGQTREWPIYHIISGGTAWDQYWGQSNEKDYDDVQKTIANWAWQILDFDLANKSMDVQCFAEANVKFPAETRWTTQGYNSRIIDSFHRRLGIAAPSKPSLTNVISDPVILPIELVGSSFTTSSAETINSTWFQVAADSGFSNLKFDLIRDIENYYGDTGAPNYEPVNIHAGIDINRYTVAPILPNGAYFARVRHRDSNASWSPWSDALSFQVSGGVAALPLMSLAKSIFAPNEDIPLAFENGPGNSTDWIGIYKKGQTPGTGSGKSGATTWLYVNGTAGAGASGIKNGSLNFTANIDIGEWFAAFFASGGYTEIATRVPFYVGNMVTLATTTQEYAEGENVVVNHSGGPAGNKDWIGIYKVDKNPGAASAAEKWSYVTGAAGSSTFAGLQKGYYYAVFMVNDGYQEISQRVRFSVGSLIASTSMTTSAINAGDDFTVTFRDGPGIPKDWIGLYRDGDTPGDQELIKYIYFNGSTAGQVTFSLPTLASGRYWVAMFTNDSYTEVSNRTYFDLVALEFTETRLETNQMRLQWKSVPGTVYVVQKTGNLGTGGWQDLQTVTATGPTHEVLVPLDSGEKRCFYRIKKP